MTSFELPGKKGKLNNTRSLRLRILLIIAQSLINMSDMDFRLEPIRGWRQITWSVMNGNSETTSVWLRFVRILCWNNGRLYFILMRLCNFELNEETGNDLNCVEWGEDEKLLNSIRNPIFISDLMKTVNAEPSETVRREGVCVRTTHLNREGGLQHTHRTELCMQTKITFILLQARNKEENECLHGHAV